MCVRVCVYLSPSFLWLFFEFSLLPTFPLPFPFFLHLPFHSFLPLDLLKYYHVAFLCYITDESYVFLLRVWWDDPEITSALSGACQYIGINDYSTSELYSASFEYEDFPSPWPVALPKPECPVFSTILPIAAVEERRISFISSQSERRTVLSKIWTWPINFLCFVVYQYSTFASSTLWQLLLDIIYDMPPE